MAGKIRHNDAFKSLSWLSEADRIELADGKLQFCGFCDLGFAFWGTVERFILIVEQKHCSREGTHEGNGP